MNTKYIILILLFAGPFTIKAQQKPAPYIALLIGASTPVGNFAKAEAGDFNHWNNKAGFAKTGMTIGIEGAYYLTNKFALAGTLYYTSRAAFNSNDVATLGASYTDAFAVDYS